MKKFTLFLFATLFSALSFAALNPYAYGLSSTLDGTTLTVNYSLNSAATSVNVVIMDGAEEVKTVTCNDKISKGSHSVDISTLDLPTGKSLTWKVVVTGNSVASPTLQSDVFNFYLPYGMDVDVDPESDYLGNWYVIEARNDAKGKAGKEHYQSYNVGRALYAFDAALQPKKNKNGQYGFTGGVYLGASQATHSGSTSIVNLYRVTTSGGRVFIGKFEPNYTPVVEVNPNDLDANFTEVIPAGKRAVSIDAIGRGENLKLVMLDTDFNLTEYDLGTKSSISSASRTINKGALSIVRNDATIVYDNEGGIWLNQHRATATATCPTIAHISAKNGFDYNNIDGGVAHNNTNNSGIAISPDGKQLAVVGAGTKKLTIYNISKTGGQISLTKAHTISTAGDNHTALSWDYAGNLYVANRSAETIQFYAMPYSGTIATPCASKYAFEVEEIVANVHTLTTNVVGEGTVEGNAGSYVEGATATLTASPAAHYDFVNWTYGSETSTDNPLIITVNSDLTVTANFQEHTKYTITAQAADNSKGYVTGGGTYYVGETVTLKAVANSTYYFVNWSDGNTDATRTFTATADVTLTANFAKASSRAWAYDLKMVEDGDNYKFSFNATTAANATLLFLDKEGKELYTAHEVGAVAAGANTVSIEKAYFTQVKDVYWSVKMDGEAITYVAEITDQTRNIYDFYNMQGVVVDNDPNSEKFGEIYIEMAKSGTTNGKAQTLGLFLLNQNLDVINTDPNVGIQPTMPSGYALNGTNYTFQRLNIHPKTGDLVFSYGISSKPAVFAIDRENMTSSVTNLLDGITGLTKTVAHCFDEDGALYVMDIVSYKGTIYKIKDGVKSTFSAATGKYAADNITMASDGRGGLWVAQNRGQIDACYQLAHVNSEGVTDWSIYDDQGGGTSSTGFTGYSTRGALAYDVERHILAQGRNSTVEVFQVAYDATTGVPTLTKIATTPQVNKANIDALAFDYAGDLYVVNSGTEKFYKYTLPTAENICTVPAPKSQFIEKEQKYTVTVEASPAEGGEVSGGGEAVEGAQVTVSANANTGYRFVNWTKGSDEVSTDASFSYTVPAENVTLIANFEEILYTLIAPTNDENKGTVTGAGTYSYGTEVTLTATPKAGYKLLYWSDRSTENPRTITMNKNEALSAYFVKEYDEEPTFTITKLWENTNVPASTNNGFQAIGWDQKIYMKDRLNAVIDVYTATSSTLYTQLGSAVIGLAGDQPIAVDDAGNIVVRSGSAFFYDAPTQVTILRKGETTGKTIDFTLPATGRCDFISASGDIYSAGGGYVYFYCDDQTTVSRLYIKNGGATIDDISVDKLDVILTNGSSQSHVFKNIFGGLMTHTRADVKVLQEVNVLTGVVTTMNLPNFKVSTLGGCSFELGGKELIAYNIAGTDYNSEWNIYNMTDKQFLSNETLYAKDKVSRKNSGASNWLNVQVVDENTAYIYQFCPEVAVAVWKVSLVRNDLENFTITATANNARMGSIVGSGEYYEGGTAMLTANANPGFRFVNWTKEGVEVSTDATYLFTVTEDVELVANFEVILLDTLNNEGILDYLNDQTVDVAVYRSLTGGMYNTLCLPFDVNELTGTPLENATIWQYNGTVKGDGTNKEIFLEFDEVESITAGEPYLVEPAEDIAAPMVFKNVTISVTSGNDVAQDAVTMHGILHPTELEANDKSILFLVENNNLAWANVTANMNGMRAYFQVNEPSLQSARTRAYIRKASTVATDMENITTTDTKIKKVIYNGNIYIIRGNEVYTVQGTKVK